MRRHEALLPLTHDHHHALVQVRRLRSAAKGSADERGAAAKGFLEFFYSDTIQHFREEEEVVFPLVVEDESMRTILEGVMVQHLFIHAAVRKLDAECEGGSPDPTTLLGLADTLERHVRFEEKVVFPEIQERVAKEAMDSIELAPRHRTLAG